MSFIQPENPFYKPLWRRVVIVAICASWLLMELVYFKQPFWAVIAAGFLGAAFWSLIWTYPKDQS
jgi:hypothetical protein